jgi:hypothetical protein
MNATQQIIAEMIEAELQQGWAALGAEKWELARMHFRNATEKVDQLEGVSKKDPAPAQIADSTQSILDV